MSLLRAKGTYFYRCVGKVGGAARLTLSGPEIWGAGGSAEMPRSIFIVPQSLYVSSSLKTNLNSLSNYPWKGAHRPRTAVASDYCHFFCVFLSPSSIIPVRTGDACRQDNPMHVMLRAVSQPRLLALGLRECTNASPLFSSADPSPRLPVGHVCFLCPLM